MPLSQKQMEYLALAWQCFDSEPKIDYEKFKTVAGLASAHSARELMRVTKNKLRDEYGALSGGVQAANINTAGGTPKKKGTAVAVGTPKNKTPASSGKGRKRAAGENGATGTSSRAADVADDEELFGESPSKKKIKVEKGEEMQSEDGQANLNSDYDLI